MGLGDYYGDFLQPGGIELVAIDTSGHDNSWSAIEGDCGAAVLEMLDQLHYLGAGGADHQTSQQQVPSCHHYLHPWEGHWGHGVPVVLAEHQLHHGVLLAKASHHHHLVIVIILGMLLVIVIILGML